MSNKILDYSDPYQFYSHKKEKMFTFDIFDVTRPLLEDYPMFEARTHREALIKYLGHNNFVRTSNPLGGDFAVKKRYGNRCWFNLR